MRSAPPWNAGCSGLRRSQTRHLVVGGINDAAVGVGNLLECLPGEGIHGGHEGLHLGRNPRQIHDDLLVIAIARACAVVARVRDAPIVALELAKPDAVGDLAPLIKHQWKRESLMRGFQKGGEEK